MRRRLGLVMTALGLFVGLIPGAATADLGNTLLCDAQGPVTIERQLVPGPGRGFHYVFKWTLNAQGTCTDLDGGAHALQMQLRTPYADVPETDTCDNIGVSPAVGGNNVFGDWGSQISITDFNGSALATSYYSQMTWLPNPVTSSYSTIQLYASFPLPGGQLVDYLGEGIEANRIFLKCPTSYPSSENGRFIFALHDRIETGV